jgi:predicted XRE-type DNA-binding protein
MSRIEHTKGSDNVFADLGIPNAEEYLAKADLAREIINIVRHRGLTQNQAAAILNVDQAKVSALSRGRLDGFSMERLTRFLRFLGKRVEIAVRPINTARPTQVALGPGEQYTSGDFSSYICGHLRTFAGSPEMEKYLTESGGPFTAVSVETVHGFSSEDWRQVPSYLLYGSTQEGHTQQMIT